MKRKTFMIERRLGDGRKVYFDGFARTIGEDTFTPRWTDKENGVRYYDDGPPFPTLLTKHFKRLRDEYGFLSIEMELRIVELPENEWTDI